MIFKVIWYLVDLAQFDHTNPVVPNLFWVKEHLRPGKVLAEHYIPNKTLAEHYLPNKTLTEHLSQ